MKKLIAGTFLCAVLGFAAQADPVHGTWKSPTSEAGASFEVTLKACGGAICGTITKLAGGADPSIKGKKMVWDMQAKGGGSYKGRIWAPDTDKTYNGKMQLSGKTLKMSGCVLGICRGENFSRVN